MIRLDLILNELKNKIGITSSLDLFNSKKQRIKIYKQNPEIFLGVNEENIPSFPIKDQYGNSSLPILKQSLLEATFLYKKTGNTDYRDIANKITRRKKLLENKNLFFSRKQDLKRYIKKNRDLGSVDIL